MLKTVLATSLFLASVLGDDINITSVEEFKTFAANPNNYNKAYLLTDLDFKDEAGMTPAKDFTGMFYGNGHVIKGLKITSDALNVGLFGSLSGSTVKDLIIDETCEFKGTYTKPLSPDEVNVGSVVGKCDKCNFENIINHANVSYEATGHSGSVYVGGIAGTFSCESGEAVSMKNAANYGAVSNNLVVVLSGKYAGAGGIAGHSLSVSDTQNFKCINCLNYGEVTTTNDNSIPDSTGTGGILGVAQGFPSFKNVVSAGSCVNEPSTTAGSILGLGVGSQELELGEKATFENCYVLADATTKKLMSGKVGYFELNEGVATDFAHTKDIFGQLNSETGYANVWVNNENEKNITFQVNDNSVYASTSKIIIAPVLSSESPYFFKGWYSDESCETAFTVNEAPDTDTKLHGGWQYLLNIKVNGGDFVGSTQYSKNVIYMHKIGTLPQLTKEGYTFAKWTYEDSAEGAEVNADTVFDKLENTNIYAQWTVNQYTITFNFNNGTEEPLVKEYDYKDTVTYPENPTWFEHTFQKWESDYGTSLNNKSMPAQNVTVNATWKLNEYQVVFHIYEGNDTVHTLGYGTNVTYPTDVTREGYTFVGWDNDAVTTTPSGGITINAIWTINTYCAILDFNNGTDPLVLELEYGTSIEYPQNVTKKGYNFVGWKNQHDTMPAYNFTATVEFAVRILTYNFMKENKVYKTVNYTFGEELDLPDGPKKSLKKFDKWCIKSTDICEPFTADDLPDGVTYFEAKYKLDVAIVVVIVVVCVVVVAIFAGIGITYLIIRKKQTARRKVPPKKKDVEMDS